MLLRRLSLFALLALALVGCGGGGITGVPGQAFALTNNSTLRRIRYFTGQFVGNPISLSVNIECIAISPVNGRLYGFGSDTKLYTINAQNGACTVVSANPTNLSTNGSGMSVDPATGNIRYVDADNNNYRINVANGTVIATDDDFAYKTGDPNDGDDPNLVACGFKQGSAFYAIDASQDTLVRATNPSNGEIETVGSTVVNFAGDVGFAIDERTGWAFAVCTGGTSGIYRVDLSTGTATPILTGVAIEDLAIIP